MSIENPEITSHHSNEGLAKRVMRMLVGRGLPPDQSDDFYDEDESVLDFRAGDQAERVRMSVEEIDEELKAHWGM